MTPPHQRKVLKIESRINDDLTETERSRLLFRVFDLLLNQTEPTPSDSVNQWLEPIGPNTTPQDPERAGHLTHSQSS
jgi:hypothetical protein